MKFAAQASAIKSWPCCLCALVLLNSSLLLSACGPESGSPGNKQLADPAMQAPAEISATSESTQVEESSSSSQDDFSTPFDTKKSFVDIDARRVYVPGSGWIEGEVFLDLYLNRPGELPGDLDLSAAHELVSLLMSQES